MAWKKRGRIFIHAKSVDIMNDLINYLDKKEKKLLGVNTNEYHGKESFFVREELYDIESNQLREIVIKFLHAPNRQFVLIADYTRNKTFINSAITTCMFVVEHGRSVNEGIYDDNDYDKRNEIGLNIPITDVVSWINATKINLWPKELQFLDDMGYVGVKNGIRIEQLKETGQASKGMLSLVLPICIAFFGILNVNSIWGIFLLGLSLVLEFKNLTSNDNKGKVFTVIGLLMSILGVLLWMMTNGLNFIVKLLL